MIKVKDQKSIDNYLRELRKKISQYGDNISFDADAWYCSRKHNSSASNSTFTLYFSKVDDAYKELIKYFVLLKEDSVSTLQSKIYSFNNFIGYLNQLQPKRSLAEVDEFIIDSYESYLRLNENPKYATDKYTDLKDIFYTLEEFDGFPNVKFKIKNPFTTDAATVPNRYIPSSVVSKLDMVMKSQKHDIPLELRTAYWLIRSFPNRMNEVLSIRHNCLKTLYSYYVLSIPSTKQSGNIRPELKALPIIYNGHGEYLINLIKEMQTQYKHLMETKELSRNKDINYLFAYLPYSLYVEHGLIRYRRRNYRTSRVLKLAKVNHDLKEICKLLNIMDSKNEIAQITSHRFRHNAVTDRRYKGSYTEEQVMAQTAHKNKKMLSRYVNPLKDIYKDVLTKNRIAPNEAGVEFKGTIMNLNEATIERLKKNRQMYLTWEAGGDKGVGMCSYIQGCSPKSGAEKALPVKFECYACDWFVPIADYIDSYRKEEEYWEGVARETESNPSRAATFENALRNLSLIQHVIEICENGIEKHKKQIVEKIKSGKLIGEVHA
jgi:hypothetical protein